MIFHITQLIWISKMTVEMVILNGYLQWALNGFLMVILNGYLKVVFYAMKTCMHFAAVLLPTVLNLLNRIY